MKNIILTGMMGCGKTTCARAVAKALGRRAVDTDELVVQMAGMSISDIFLRHGEETMRDIETQVCRNLSQSENLVIATGGGLPLRQVNRELLRENGVVVFLNRDPGEVYDHSDMSGRPLGQAGREAFLQRFADREPIYREFAHVVIDDFSTLDATVREILEKVEERL